MTSRRVHVDGHTAAGHPAEEFIPTAVPAGTRRPIPVGGEFLIREPESIFTPEQFDSDARMMAEAAAGFMRGEVLPAADRIEEKEPGLLPGLLRKAGQLGFMGTDVPEQYGGLALKKSVSALIAEKLAVEPSFAVSHSVHATVATLPILFFGTSEQRRRFLPQLATGELIGAYALSEAHAGSDAMAARTRASPCPAGFRINGEKAWITNAAFAGLFIVFAKIDDRLSAFVVEGDRAGVSIGREEHKLGLKGSSTARGILDNVEVPRENLLGEPGDGGKIALYTLNLGRFKIAASAVGQSKNLLGIATRYSLQRHAFGKAIAEHGLIQEKLATMAARTLAAESILYRVAGLLDDVFYRAESTEQYSAAAAAYAIECAIAKVYCTETLGYAADECLQIHGGYGYSEEYAPARAWRDARVTRIYEGTNEINRLNITSLLHKRLLSSDLPSVEEENGMRAICVNTLRTNPLLPSDQLLSAGMAEICIALFASDSASLRTRSRLASDQAACAAAGYAQEEPVTTPYTITRKLAAWPPSARPSLRVDQVEIVARAVINAGGYPW